MEKENAALIKAREVALKEVAALSKEMGHELILTGVVNATGSSFCFYYDGAGWLRDGNVEDALAGNLPIEVTFDGILIAKK